MEPTGDMRRTLFFLSGMTLAVYAVLRPLMLRWGTRDNEATRPMPGDDLILHPHISATFAVDIDAPTRVVWHWLLQMVEAGAGFDALRGLQGASQTLPIEVGMILADDYAVMDARAENLMVLYGPGDGPRVTTYIWQLEATSPTTTRLVFRYWQAAFGIFGILYNILSEPAQFILRQVWLRTLRQRAQNSTQTLVLSKDKSNGHFRIPLEN